MITYFFQTSDLCRKLEQGQCTDHLLGDSAYPLKAYHMTPISNPTRDSEIRYNAAHAKARNNIERVFSACKRRFRVLSSRLRTELNTFMLAICNAAILHNIAFKHRDVPANAYVDSGFHNEYEVEREGAANTSRSERLSKRTAIINSVYS